MITLVIPTYGKVNAILYLNDFIYISNNSNKIIKFDTNGKLLSQMSLSGKINNLNKINLFGKNVICSSNESSYIDIVYDEILFKLIY